MKKRNGFVSNSSSSSFTCEVCGETQSGWDMSLSEAEMTECEHGHTICNEHYSNKTELTLEDKRKFLVKCYNERINGYYKNEPEKQKEYYDLIDNICNKEEDEIDDELHDYDLQYSFPSEFCPICNLDIIQNDTVLSYIIKKLNLNKEEIKTEIKNNYKTLKDVNNYCKEEE